MIETRKKIGFFTGTRAEYGLLRPLMALVNSEESLELLLFVSGSHLSPEFGNTYTIIQQDGFKITESVESLLSADTPSAITKSIGLGMIGLADALVRNRPDVLVILGDRFEALSAAVAAMLARIPIAHIHGGELTEGAIDDSIRHAITKMSTIHFVSTDQYRRRVIQLGEEPDRVFTVGALGIDLIYNSDYANKEEVYQRLPFLTRFPYSLLVTLHPETTHKGNSLSNAKTLLNVLDSFPHIAIVFTGANADTEGRCINELFTEYCKHTTNCVFERTLGSYYYLGLMREVSAVVGNSSSGILEAPALRIPSVDIGIRQQGRVAPKSVIHCCWEKADIIRAVEKALKKEGGVLDSLIDNPYWHGGAAEKIFHVLLAFNILSQDKCFFDLNTIQ